MKLTKFQGLMLIVSETGMEAGQPDEGRSARGRRVMWVICSPHGSHCQTTFNSASISLRFSMWRLVYNSTFSKTDCPHFSPHKVCRKPRLPVDVGTMTLFRILPFTERYFAGNSDRSFALSAQREREVASVVGSKNERWKRGEATFIVVSYSDSERGKRRCLVPSTRPAACCPNIRVQVKVVSGGSQSG